MGDRAEHTAFTPPPWHYYPRGEGFIIRSKSAQGPIAGVNGNRPIVGAEANARLIAAAPDLLAALKALQLQALQSTVNDPSNEWGQEALAMTRAAISRATGEA